MFQNEIFQLSNFKMLQLAVELSFRDDLLFFNACLYLHYEKLMIFRNQFFRLGGLFLRSNRIYLALDSHKQNHSSFLPTPPLHLTCPMEPLTITCGGR